MKEIGSEIMNDSSAKGKNEYVSLVEWPRRYVISGRTGLYLVANEILMKNSISRILLPSYCCASMIAPFVDNHFEISFYDSMNLSNVNFSEIPEAILLMDYFGFLSDETYSFAEICKSYGKIVIIDATQTAFCNSQTYECSDYIIVSYRKWFDCLCAIVYSREDFCTPEYCKEAKKYVDIWRNAARAKEEYIKRGIGKKNSFLQLFSEANSMLERDYIGYKASESEISKLKETDSNYLRMRRRSNSQLIIDRIKNLPIQCNVTLLYNGLEKNDCPLFVPIFVDSQKRNNIRQRLINRDIYCPTHWPIDEKYPYSKTVYHDIEISLVCDQRYDDIDILREVDEVIGVISDS